MTSDPYRTPTTVSEVRDYVLGGAQTTGRSQDTLLINVEHSNLKQTRLVELRMDRRATINELKQRLYLHTGTRPDSMQLILRDATGAVKGGLSDETRSLAEYGAQAGDSLLLVDDDPHSASTGGWLEDTTLVKKYVMPDEVYDKRQDTYRAFKKRMRQQDPDWTMASAIGKGGKSGKSGKSGKGDVDMGEEAPMARVGERVEVFPGGKRGVVKFVGRDLQQLPRGWWIGVCYDEPVGKNDGSVKGVRYFHAEQGYGGLVRPSKVTVGDFPPLNDGNESEDEI